MKKEYKSFPNEVGEVWIPRVPESFAETVKLGLGRFFKRITVDGIYST
nr:hypothetical protein [uncultured Merdimonas sp.]